LYGDHGVTTSLETQAPLDGWLHGYTIEVVDTTNRVVEANMLHHITVLAPDRRELFAPIMMRVIAAGMETGAVRMPDAYGYPLKRGERLQLRAMLHNPTNQAHKSLRVRLRMAFSPRAAVGSRTPAEAFPFHISINEPAQSPEFDLPIGRTTHKRHASSEISGRIYALGGHLHQYGVSLSLEDTTTGKVVWTSNAERDSEGNILRVPNNHFPKRGVRIEAGHIYRVTTVYDNTSGKVVEGGGMALVGGLFIPDRGAAWPAVDRQHPTWLLDLETGGALMQEHKHRHGGPR
jgi:hypothetical protein